MFGFVAKRIVSALLTLLLVSVFTFSLSHMAGDPAAAIAGKEATSEDIERIREYYGFDRSVTVQYFDWLGKALTGDFGSSFHYRQPVSQMLATRLPVTFTLAFSAMIFALIIGVPLGILAALRPGSIVDRLSTSIAVVGQAMPTFWFALMLIVFFGLTLKWLPISGNTSWKHYVMPTIALGYFATPALMRLTRSGMIQALQSDYIRTAKAKGLRTGRILFRHAFRNVVVAIVAISSVQFGSLLGGSIVAEQIFSLQGLGWLGYDATIRSDLPVLQAITLVVAAFYVFLTLTADLINIALDPRLRSTR